MDVQTPFGFKLLKFFVSAIGLVAAVFTIQLYFEGRQPVDLSGEWKVINTIETTSYKRYQGLQLGYRIFFHQNQKNITAYGEKCWENETKITPKARTPIRIVGSIKGSDLVATFVEQGTRRTTNGKFVLKLEGGNKLLGTFESTAANTTGSTVATRITRSP